MANKLEEVFGIEKPIIGMIHLTGKSKEDIICRALHEASVLYRTGVDGMIVEDYHCRDLNIMVNVLDTLSHQKERPVLGINVLQHPYSGFKLAKEHDAKFIQFDSVYPKDINIKLYDFLREKYSGVIVLGGVGFKYTRPTGNPLEKDLMRAMQICDAIVTTGQGTGIETPIEKLREYKEFLEDFPLIVGAGTNVTNIAEQIKIVDGAIVGSGIKPGRDTSQLIDEKIALEYMNKVKASRSNL